MTCKNRYVHSKKPWGSLRKRNYINEVLVVKPFALNEFAFDCSYHRDASTDGERSYLGKYPKYSPQTNHELYRYLSMFYIGMRRLQISVLHPLTK
jgi:hypothetical protein